ncbi:hypothetical protein BDV96DRAFT_601162 [Lophiotrema nucula]|uniref:Uncharacterized protein n=1 Tax=Lophiotrema nucula TaxID=690887 RepID=A0A6A5Z2L5_9PLEO|nr:hypothetical protein BDV96DRAFT_601162 [Lophiotrema nucula]
MAKRKPTLSSKEMETALGYDGRSLTHTSDTSPRFYSDLTPVADHLDERLKREYEEYAMRKHSQQEGSFMAANHLQLDGTRTITNGQHTITLIQRNYIGIYRFTVDVHYGFGFHLPLLFTGEEACRTVSLAKLQLDQTRAVTQGFFKLPPEIRDHIYTLAIPNGTWNIQEADSFDRSTFVGSIGDLSGYYYPLSKVLGILHVNRKMRQEALPLAIRATTFSLDDMDDIFMLLIAIGETGRDNIESLHFPWESRSDMESKWEEDPAADDHVVALPKLHAMTCVQLLKQCKRLRFLRLYFGSDLVGNMAPEAFKSDPGIQELCAVRIEQVEVWSLGHKSLKNNPLADWLRDEMQRSGARMGSMEREPRHGS